MRLVQSALLASTLMACSRFEDTRIPTAPVPPAVPTSSMSWIWGMAVDESGACVGDATATVIKGQLLGLTVAQATPCGAWDYDGGFVFKDLLPGVEMTVRVDAPGYSRKELTVVPSSGSVQAVLFVMTRAP